ncbi:MAG TPA: hypothetical protein VM867_08300 [Xanthobacteraceae bacterium]|nr:hypothetical protein [Xanthobacteraceae bacterium]
MSLQQEKAAAGKVIDRALAKGCFISVNDGGEWVVKKSTKRREIMDALASTDADHLMIRDANGERVGVIYLVWGNGDPDTVVCDYTDKPAIREIVEGASA